MNRSGVPVRYIPVTITGLTQILKRDNHLACQLTGFFYTNFRIMSLIEDFELAAKNSTQLPERPNNENLLKLYGLYKQATEGDNTGDKPGGFDFKALAKHEAWSSLKGKSKEDAMQEYVDLVNRLAGG